MASVHRCGHNDSHSPILPCSSISKGQYYKVGKHHSAVSAVVLSFYVGMDWLSTVEVSLVKLFTPEQLVQSCCSVHVADTETVNVFVHIQNTLTAQKVDCNNAMPKHLAVKLYILYTLQ